MSSTLAAFICVSLLLLAAGLFAFGTARARQQREQMRITVDRQLAQIKTVAARAAEARGTQYATQYPAQLASPGAVTAAQPPGAPRAQGLWEMPAWLLDTVPQAAAILVPAAILAVGGILAVTAGLPAGIAFIVLASMLAVFVTWLRLQARRRELVVLLPGFMDSMVRLISIGNSTQSAFQTSASIAKPPLRGYMDKVSAMLRAGMDLEVALLQVAESIRIEQLVLLASVLGLGVRYGGRADVLIERMANFMRDEEQAGRELQALSAETRLSAWILGLLPVLVGGFIIMINAAYFTLMWTDPAGKFLMLAAIGLQLVGAAILYRMARLD